MLPSETVLRSLDFDMYCRPCGMFVFRGNQFEVSPFRKFVGSDAYQMLFVEPSSRS